MPEKVFEYVVNGRSPIEWVIERYQIKTDKASGIENNPNDWRRKIYFEVVVECDDSCDKNFGDSRKFA